MARLSARLTVLVVLVSAHAILASADKACPSFDNGTWAVGELRNFETVTGEPSRIMDHFYEDKSTRACCDACSRITGCSYWTWFEKELGSLVGDCVLFKSFACDTDPAGELPLIHNKMARTGSNICSRPESRDEDAPLEDKKEAAIAEMKAALNAELAVREEESVKWKGELDVAESELAEAEKESTKLEEAVLVAKGALEQATAEVERAKQAESKAEEALEAAEDAVAKMRAKATQEAAFAEKAREEYIRVGHEIESARRAKQSADEILVVEIAELAMQKDEEREKNPYVECPPTVEDGRWAVGLLRDVGGSKLGASYSDVSPRQCCTACSRTADCKYWSWAVSSKFDVTGLCSLFGESGCKAGPTGKMPFNRDTKLGRVGKACDSSAV